MADDAKVAPPQKSGAPKFYTVKNVQPGPRGLWSDGALSYVDPDTTALATLSDGDKDLADKTGYFEIADATDAEKKAFAAG